MVTGSLIVGTFDADPNNQTLRINAATLLNGNTIVTGSIGVTNIVGTGSLFLQPNQGDVRFVEIYNTSPTDTHITASGGQIFLGNDVTYLKVDNYGSVKHIDIVADNGVNISGSVQITGSLDVSGSYIRAASFSCSFSNASFRLL